MPVSVQSHYTDLETGDTFLVPQLYPHAVSGEITSSKEIEVWVQDGIIPKEVFDYDVKSRKEMDAVLRRLEIGERVSSEELPRNPWMLTEFLINNKASLYGENVLKKIFSHLVPSDPDAVWLSFVKEAITSITPRDPLPIHFLTARSCLKKNYGIEDQSAIDSLAREILVHCESIKHFKALNDPIFDKVTITPKELDKHFEDGNGRILSLDLELADYLKRQGKAGKEASKEIQKQSEALFAHYKENNYADKYRSDLWSLWVVGSTNEKQISPFLDIITKVAWETTCSAIWHRQSKQIPAITKPIIESIKPILNPKEKKRFIRQNESIVCVNESGVPLIFAPAVDLEMITLLQKGVKDLSTLTGHRLLRWQIKVGFERWSSGEQDPRVIEIDGGYSGIADFAGCHQSPKDIAKVKAILHAQAYGSFVYHDGSRGNMITLRVLDKYKNNEPSKIRIVLGDILLPNYIFKIGNKSERRLIPIGDLPPLYGAKNTHAQQAHLQLLVFEEFSNQSDKLANNGCVVITKEKWVEMAFESGLNPKRIISIVDHWCQPNAARSFLDKQGDEFRFAPYYEDAQKFLVHQGDQRIVNSKRGRASAIRNKKAKLQKG